MVPLRDKSMHKLCRICQDIKQIDLFPKNKSTKDGHDSLCKDCESKRQHKKYLVKNNKTETKTWKLDMSALYAHADTNNGKCLSTEYFGSKTKYHWQCSCGNKWFASLPTTTNRWCPKCAILTRKATKKLLYGNSNYNNRNKSKVTCLEKYGSTSNMGNREIALKNAKARNFSYIDTHWLTNEEIVCQGSYERDSVRYLNHHKINYDWQIPFKLSDGRTYIIDFLNKDTKTYVEIKGWWRDDAKQKFELFKSDNPTLQVEVWDGDKLKELGIKRRNSEYEQN